jgi:hypothetical protein
MSDYRLLFPACVVAGKGCIDVSDVMMLRKHSFPDGVRSRNDAIVMVALHRSCPTQCVEWQNFFIESLAAYVVFLDEPVGLLDEAKASWLAGLLAEEGMISSYGEFEMILHAIELAAEVSPALTAFALDQIRHAMTAGSTCILAADRQPNAAISSPDLELIWRILRSRVDCGRLILAPQEIDALKEIDLLTVPSQNHPDWNDLMAQIAATGRPGHALELGIHSSPGGATRSAGQAA